MISRNESEIIAKPFVKWAGGKKQLLKEIEKKLPAGLKSGEITTYIEPFIGGGAVFFYIAQQYPKIKHFYLIDINEDLIHCYQTIKSNINELIEELKKLREEYLIHTDKAGFYSKIRLKFNCDKEKKHNPEITAKLIFLNKTCFNGLYRVNSKNEFNVPLGENKHPKICDETNLRAVSQILQKAEIICDDFTASRKYINKRSFIYLDPPYRPLNKTANFTSYSKDSFTENDQIRLAEFCREIEKRDAKFLLSNSDPHNENPKDNFFYDHFEGFDICKVKASRMINCKAIGRGKISELIITN